MLFQIASWIRSAKEELVLAIPADYFFVKPMSIRILVIDDSAAFRGGLRELLEAHADWEVCGEAADGMEGVEKNRLLKPRVIIMDQSMPRMSGIDAAEEILKESPDVSILLLTLYLTNQLAQEARKIGIRATFSKAATGHLVGGIDVLLGGQACEATS